jgi:uncharacterized protein YjiS (DUF1127 family)
MQQIAQHATQPLPVEPRAPALPAPLQRRPLPRLAQPPRLVRALLWQFRLLFVQPVGRRARAERLSALPDRTLRDIGLRRADVQAAASDLVRLCDLVPAYPSAGPLYVCGRPDLGSGTPPDPSTLHRKPNRQFGAAAGPSPDWGLAGSWPVQRMSSKRSTSRALSIR